MTVNDLSPEALERLEAKLVADLEMVRRVRALLLEHRDALGIQAAAPGVPSSMAPVAAAPAVAMPPMPPTPQAPSKSMEEMMEECLLEMPTSGFRLNQLNTALGKRLRNYPTSGLVQRYLKPLMRKGQVIVLEVGKGRAGSLYQSLIPRPKVEALPGDSAPQTGESVD